MIVLTPSVIRYSLYSSCTHCCSLSSWAPSGAPPGLCFCKMALTHCLAPLGPVLRHLPYSLLRDIMMSSSLSLRYLGSVSFVTTTMTDSDGGK
jgi:hypothetical protein